jgi:hypothetical protein
MPSLGEFICGGPYQIIPLFFNSMTELSFNIQVARAYKDPAILICKVISFLSFYRVLRQSPTHQTKRCLLIPTPTLPTLFSAPYPSIFCVSR